MATKIHLLFFAKRSRTTSQGTVPIYLRVSIQGKRMEVTINRFVLPNQWSFTAGRVKANVTGAKEINSHLEDIRLQIHAYEQEILREGKALTIQAIRQKWFGVGEIKHTIMEAIGVHNAEMEFLVGKDFGKPTLVKYRTTEKHVQDFIHWKYNCMDIVLSELTIEFLKNFEFYLQGVKRLSINSRGKMLSNVKKIVGECPDKGWLVRDPFVRFHVKHVDAKVPHLSADELLRIEEKNFSSERLSVVKDIFLFSCYTGFAYIDVASLTPAHLKVDSDGKPWLVKDRQKTNILEQVPLLPPAVKILEKYKDHPIAIKKGKLLPVPTNQKVNAYLKEIVDLCSIVPKLTFHIARHTFATTITLDNGVSLESVSHMLGHKFIKTTQVYAKVSNKKIKEEMSTVFRKFSENKTAEPEAGS